MKQICQSSKQHFMLYAFVYLERVLFLTFRAPSGPQSEGETGQLFTPQFLKASLVIRYSPKQYQLITHLLHLHGDRRKQPCFKCIFKNVNSAGRVEKLLTIL